MNLSSFLIFCLNLCLLLISGWAQQTEETNPWKAPRPVLPEAVLRAKVLSSTTSLQENGGTLTVEVISPPAISAELPVPSLPGALTAPLNAVTGTLEKRPAASLKALKLFSASVTVYEGTGISRISWWGGRESKEFTAFVKLDLSSIGACGDLEKNGTRYLLFPVVHPASARFSTKENPPLLTDFQLDSDIILSKGDASDTEGMEPLLLLLEKYDTEGGLIASTAAAMKADQEARAAWEQAHPEKPENVVIKMWPVQSTEYPTAQTAGK